MWNIFLNRGIRWKPNPGCFERHLQRRCQNFLFPKSRRIVSSGELLEARDKDLNDFKDYANKFSIYNARSPKELGSPQEMFRILQEDMAPLIQTGISVSGEASKMIEVLLKEEEVILQYLQKYHSKDPKILELINKWASFAQSQRNVFLVQSTRGDSPILKDEIVATFLSEDLNTIRHCGLLARSFPKWEWTDSDVVQCLKRGVEEGFNEKKAVVLLDAFREWPITKFE